jgi:Zn-dependent protease/predicted transcriptional regulator
MRGWSFPIGRFLGVDVRIHIFFLILLGLAVSYASAMGASGGRGLSLWLMLLLAVVVRETGRALGAAWWGLKVRSLLLLPTGGLVTYQTTEATERAGTVPMQRRLALMGPAANILFGLVIAGLVLTITPQVNLIERPWVTPTHLLRAMVWVNLLLGLVNLLPAVPLDGGRVFRGEFSKAQGGLKGIRAAAGLGQVIAFSLMLGGLFFANIWLTMIGAFVLIGAHMEDQGMLLQQSDNETVKMKDVMMSEFSMLSASDTLEDALQRSVHSLQDVFPVVRGRSMVGAVSRQGILDALQSDGNGYVQGVMTKSFQTAHPDDSLVKTLRRVMSGQGAQLLPILEGEQVVGIITPQNLAHSIGMLNHSHKTRPTE